MKFYFLGGLGSNPYYPLDFFESLGLPVQYLNLYDGALEALEKPEQLLAWFAGQVDLEEEVVLLGHSMGADFAVYFASQFAQIRQLILLDGGFLNMEAICSLEEELADAASYLQQTSFSSLQEAIADEKAAATVWTPNLERAAKANWRYDEADGKWKLSLSWQLVSNLLRIRREIQGNLEQLASKRICLLIPEAGDELPAWRQQALASLPAFVELTQVPDCGHNMYLDRPDEIGRLVKNLLQT